MSDAGEDLTPRPHRPVITPAAVLLAIRLGSRCPHRLATVFDVQVMHPDLVAAVNVLAERGVIGAGRAKHVGPDGVTCSPIVLRVLLPDLI